MYRKHLRLKEFDYSSSNWYFVTICTDFRKKLFVSRVSGKYGTVYKNVVAASYAANNTNIVEQTLHRIVCDYYNNLEIDFYCTMEDHIHMIVAFHGNVTRKGAIRSRNYKLSDIIVAFKSIVTRQIGIRVFQPNFYEHVIRNEKSLHRIREYILNNPLVEYSEIPWKVIDPA